METSNYGLGLREKLVREVAAPYFEAAAAEESKKAITDEIREIERNKEECLKAFSAQMVAIVKGSSVEDAEKEVSECKLRLQQYEKQIETLQDKLANQEKTHAPLRRQAHEALQNITNEILAGNFGRGEFQLTQQELRRVFGRIDQNESLSYFGLSVRGNLHTLGQQIKQLSEACRDSIPLVNVDAGLMPLTSEEASDLCRSEDDYFLLKKFVPINLISWKLNSIYRVRREQDCEMYLVILPFANCTVVKVEKGVFPKYTLTVLGVMTERDDNFIEMELKYWDGQSREEWHNGQERVSWPILECDKKDMNMALSILATHLHKKHPGIICQYPQLED